MSCVKPLIWVLVSITLASSLVSCGDDAAVPRPTGDATSTPRRSHAAKGETFPGRSARWRLRLAAGRRLRKGMTMEEVEAVLGPPHYESEGLNPPHPKFADAPLSNSDYVRHISYYDRYKVTEWCYRHTGLDYTLPSSGEAFLGVIFPWAEDSRRVSAVVIVVAGGLFSTGEVTTVGID